MALSAVPDWAAEIVDRMIGPLPMCGHYAFPRPLLQICMAVGKKKCPAFVCGCYTADSERKVLLSYYVYCLDAWLKRAPLETTTVELMMRDSLGKDWPQIISAIYDALGAFSPQKVLLIRRLIHRLRWWIKTLIWLDDKRDRYLLDVYMGDVRGDQAGLGSYGNAPFGDPYSVERDLPEMKELAANILETVPNGQKLLDNIESTWLCAPKAFRYLEKIIVQIGGVESKETVDTGVSILQCEDTYPDGPSHQSWYRTFMSVLGEWLDGNSQSLSKLGEITPVKHWLVRMLAHKLRLYAKYDPFGNLVGTRSSSRKGTSVIMPSVVTSAESS
jgi:hypothetical protein